MSKGKIDKKFIETNTYSLKTLSTPRTARVLSVWLVGIGGLIFLSLFLPWQQNVEATGTLTALNPQDRPQEVHTAIPGRIKEWRVIEGQFVNKNDTLVVLEEIKDDYFDPELLRRLEDQLNAKRDAILATNRKLGALDSQLGALGQGLQLSLQKAQNKYQQALLKVTSDSAEYQAEKVNYEVAKIQFDRYNTLYEQSLISLTELERRKLKLQETGAKLISLENKYLVSKNEMINTLIELNSLRAEYGDKIAKSESDKSSALGYLADAQSELAKLKNKYANMVIRNNQYYILAPQDGYIVKAMKSGIGETIKETDGIATIMPAEPDVAAEIYVRAMDVPLLAKGRHVRLEFDGWPALQFSGWPSVSVGTFGGSVKVIDYVDSKEGKFRVLVVPEKGEKWPKQLRIGSGVYGWVMLDDVPVWYEIWRQLNGFPPSLYAEPDENEKKDTKSDLKTKIKVKK
ncbi:MAG TPA: biotin attachment protein [Microscillaceae bacterium]|nr:biotin attachment protein [Microscillaceae bacterium]